MAASSMGVCRAEAGGDWCWGPQCRVVRAGSGRLARSVAGGLCQEEGAQVSGLVSGSPLRTRRCCVDEAYGTVRG